MEVFKRNINILLLYLIAVSCVGDDGLFEKDIALLDMQNSIAIVTVLSELRITEMTEEQDEELCFRFNYPLTLGYNTGATIVVADFNGFKETVFSQTSSFNVSKVNFPFSVQLKLTGESITITNEQQFTILISDCEFNTIRKQIDTHVGVCFDYKYPVKLIDKTNTLITITTQDALNAFLTAQGETYQPNHIYPLNVTLLSSNETKEINSNYEFYNILNSCIPVTTTCPIPDLTLIETTDLNKFLFKATTLTDATYEWSLDDVVIPDQTTSLYVSPPFTPGNHKVCVIISSERAEMECADMNKYPFESCNTFNTPEVCPEVMFEKAGSDPNRLFARLIEPSSYDRTFSWFVDNQIVDQSNVNHPTDSFFLSNLDDGTYEICVKSKSIFCNTESVYCEQITVDLCPEPTFTITEVPTTPAGDYIFEATFPKKDSLNYDWVIDDVVIKRDGNTISFPDATNRLEYTFDTPGTHNVCIRAIVSSQCPSGTKCTSLTF